jgi:hypothetical protein
MQRRAIEEHFSSFLGDDTARYLYEGALADAVLSDECVEWSGSRAFPSSMSAWWHQWRR